MKEKNNRMFVVNINSNDIFFEADINAGNFWSTSVQGTVEDIVNKSGLKANRKEPKSIKVQVDSISIKDGKQVRSFYNKYDISLPLMPMTEEEFRQEQVEILSEVPHEFHEAFISMAWDRGHSSGYEEVISHLKNLVNELSSSINAFARRVSKTI